MRFAWILMVGLLMLATTAQGVSNQSAVKATSIFGPNLLQNGSAEIQTGNYTKVPGWSPANGFEVAKYGSFSGEWDSGRSGCADCGKYYLRLAFAGTARGPSTSQTVEVSSAATEIDHGKVTATVSAYLGGYIKSDTTSVLMASFRDAAGKELGTLRTRGVDTSELPEPKSGSAGLRRCEASGRVPVGTRKIIFTWHAISTGTSGEYLAVGDDFALHLKAAQK
jgi:hypothetical protein